MHIIVQKFGGTSVATSESRNKVVQKIKKAVESGVMPVVVVSAIGRKGAPYATDTLIEFVSETAGEMSPHSSDMLLSCGEIISAVTMTTLLEKEGLKAQAFTGGQAGIITDNYYQKADLLCAKPEGLLAALEAGIIPVVAGFQGMTKDGNITTLGRGGSDTSAAMLGASLKAERIEIYTDVDGIMTADPNICGKAKIIPAISYTEVFQMADSGAKVIHPRAVEYAMRAGIPLVIKNTFSDEKGTYILQNVESFINKEKHHHKVITSVAHRYHRTQFTIRHKVSELDDLLGIIANAGISIDLINIFPNDKVFTIDEADEKALKCLLEKQGYSYEVLPNCAKVTVIGERMTGVPGVMARIVRALSKEHIEIYQTADSLTTIACLIKEEHVAKAIDVLHDEFHL
ncbi:MAG: aspartate kinase [Candidatus Cellulosilyticum pullistercoris]|uniref:Aspartokinase n=1 Tax=Candidatus Cellulosilyticum pullistercoris TaxID=2838521 RepID=A0A9E2KD95_9FIRM|nr:aspartate kinase [Candidatus Cellulosilyticum pullistercoris]